MVVYPRSLSSDPIDFIGYRVDRKTEELVGIIAKVLALSPNAQIKGLKSGNQGSKLNCTRQVKVKPERLVWLTNYGGMVKVVFNRWTSFGGDDKTISSIEVTIRDVNMI